MIEMIGRIYITFVCQKGQYQLKSKKRKMWEFAKKHKYYASQRIAMATKRRKNCLLEMPNVIDIDV